MTLGGGRALKSPMFEGITKKCQTTEEQNWKKWKSGKNCKTLLESIFGVQRATGLAFESEINYPSSHCTATMSYVQVELI